MKKQANKGQITVEVVLIISIFVFISTFILKQFQEGSDAIRPVYKFISGPWKAVAVMMESGVWLTDPEDGRAEHPNQFSRWYSQRGDRPH